MKPQLKIGGVHAGAFDQALAELQATTYVHDPYHTIGAILVDEYDPIIMDDVRRESILWNRIDKRLAPGEYTGGFDETAVQTARFAPRRTLGFSATSPTRTTRTPKTIKALTCDSTFGIFDRSVYQQQGRRFGDLQAKDVQDIKTALIRGWAGYAYSGSTVTSDNQFDGLLRLLTSGATSILSTDSILIKLVEKIVNMTNSADTVVRPTGIYTNAMVVWMIGQELLSVGEKLLYAPTMVGTNVFDVAQLPTPAGFLPMFADPFNSVVAGTPNTYPTFILSEDKLSWQYVEVLGAPGADPQLFEIALTTGLDLNYKGVMFGALELLGSSSHHLRVNVEYRTTVVKPASGS